MKYSRFLIIIFVSAFISKAYSQTSIKHGIVLDVGTKTPLPFTTIQFADNYLSTISNAKGEFSLRAENDSVELVFSCVGYQSVRINFYALSDTISLKRESYSLSEVNVFGSENTNLYNATTINETAINYNQTASLKDVFQLLPGNLSTNPNLSVQNEPIIREIEPNNSSSMGTALIIDGSQVSANANMQLLTSVFNIAEYPSRFGLGNDLRAVATEDIESIEVIKGIPSVVYGDLSSGVINIKTKLYTKETSVKLKFNPTLFSTGISKGIFINENNNLGASLSYASSNFDSRKPLSTYNRLNFALGSEHRFNTHHMLTTKLSAYATLNSDKKDKDILLENELFKEDYSSIRLNISYSYKGMAGVIKALNASLQGSMDKQMSTYSLYTNNLEPIAYSVSMLEGENFAHISAGDVLTRFGIEGRPVQFKFSSQIKFGFDALKISNSTLLGIETNYEKNFGEGVSFNENSPPRAHNYTIRSRKFSDVPALIHNVFFLEESLNKRIRNNRFEAQFGIRHTTYNVYKTLNMLWEPRVNFNYTNYLSKMTKISFHGGYGIQYKLPMLLHLYPGDAWLDMISVNHYDAENPENSYVLISSSNVSTENNNLKPAKSEKWEIGLDFKIPVLNITLTAFSENHTNSILFSKNYHNTIFNTYNYSDISNYNVLPQTLGIPSVQKEFYNSYQNPSNRKSTLKQGIEYVVSSPKIKSIQTSLNLSGAWFKTKTINNVEPYLNLPISNTQEQFDYIGIYDGGDGEKAERFSSNLRAITHIPELRIVFSLSVQTVWMNKYSFLRTNEIPTHLKHRDGTIIPFTGAFRRDPYFAPYINTSNDRFYVEENLPIISQLNFKLSKEIFETLKVSFLVNNIFNYRPVYALKKSGTYLRMNAPLFFGLNLNYTL